MYEIKFTADAVEDLRWFGKVDRKKILAVLESQLSHEPAVETRNRKRLRPNKLAKWELRIDRTRVFFDIDPANQLIQVRAIGYKRGSRLWIHGEEYQL
jgi:mRNA-degrading endonuclease RelE of RelBE toxin-antitoxin system